MAFTRVFLCVTAELMHAIEAESNALQKAVHSQAS